jgi:hypothetical protein
MVGVNPDRSGAGGKSTGSAPGMELLTSRTHVVICVQNGQNQIPAAARTIFMTSKQSYGDILRFRNAKSSKAGQSLRNKSPDDHAARE